MRLSTDMYHGLVFLLNSFHDEKYERESSSYLIIVRTILCSEKSIDADDLYFYRFYPQIIFWKTLEKSLHLNNNQM